MPKLTPRIRAVPWMMALQGAFVLNSHWRKLTAKERQRLVALVRAAHGRPGNLSAREREELRRLVSKLDLVTAGRSMLPLARGGGKRKS